MKTRNGFVTNSSSSSYVCEICNQAEVSYEGLDEIGMCECPNGHIICQDHVIALSDAEVNLSYITTMLDTYGSNERYKEYADQLYALVSMSSEERETWIQDNEVVWVEMKETVDIYEGSAYISEIECPICTDQHVSEYEMLKYVEEYFNITQDEIKEAIRKLKREEREML